MSQARHLIVKFPKIESYVHPPIRKVTVKLAYKKILLEPRLPKQWVVTVVLHSSFTEYK